MVGTNQSPDAAVTRHRNPRSTGRRVAPSTLDVSGAPYPSGRHRPLAAALAPRFGVGRLPVLVEPHPPAEVFDPFGAGYRYWTRRPFRHAAGREWVTVVSVALGLAAMVILPILVISLIPAGLGDAIDDAQRTPAAVAVNTTHFAPATIEAEAPTNRLSGSARVDAYPDASGGRIVHGLGNYHKPQGPGVLRFNITAPVDGTYTLTFYYVHLNGDGVRTAVITVDSDPPVSVSVAGSLFCCRSRSLPVHLRSGYNSIAFGNPTDHAPSIDRIVISAP